MQSYFASISGELCEVLENWLNAPNIKDENQDQK